MSTAAHSKDNGSPTSVAHNLDDSVVVRRDDLVVIDNAALGTLCEESSACRPRHPRLRVLLLRAPRGHAPRVLRRRGGPAAELHPVDEGRRDEVGPRGQGHLYLWPRGLGARDLSAAGLDGAHARDAPPGAGGPVLPALSFPSRTLPEDKN